MTLASGTFQLLTPGPHTLLQDLGRKGMQHLGFCQSGAADEHSFLWANKLLNNDAHCACLEITLGPFEATVDGETKIAVTGAAQHFYLNGEKISSWQSINVSAGDKITIKAPAQGMRTYIAIKHGFHFNSVLDSAAMVIKEGSGPFGGKPFCKNATLEFSSYQNKDLLNRLTPPSFVPEYPNTVALNIIINEHSEYFDDNAINNLLTSHYKVGSQSNRMAYCLEGNTIDMRKNTSMYSSGVPFGSVQVPPNGQPIVLLKDRQTIGGYPIIGYVSHLSCFQLAQLQIGQEVSFKTISLKESQNHLREFYNFF